jgi:hypothetical protein
MTRHLNVHEHVGKPLSGRQVGGNAHVSPRDEVVSVGYNWEVYAASMNEESESGRESPDGAHRQEPGLRWTLGF